MASNNTRSGDRYWQTLAGRRGGYVDRFVLDHLPPPADWPVLDYATLPELADPAACLNCAAELLDRHVAAGHGDRPALWFEDQRWSYAELLAWSNRIAAALEEDIGVRPGNRVLLRGCNSPWMVAAWFAVLKAGGVVVTTMPQLRARELTQIVDKAAVGLALCDARLADELPLPTVGFTTA